MDEAARDLTGHAIATLAYRGARILRDAPAGFGGMRAGAPDWRTAWQAVPAGGWDDECRRFHA